MDIFESEAKKKSAYKSNVSSTVPKHTESDGDYSQNDQSYSNNSNVNFLKSGQRSSNAYSQSNKKSTKGFQRSITNDHTMNNGKKAKKRADDIDHVQLDQLEFDYLNMLVFHAIAIEDELSFSKYMHKVRQLIKQDQADDNFRELYQ